VSVYAPEPKFSMLKVPELPVVALRFCEPFADIRTPGIATGFCPKKYLTVPAIDPVGDAA
jgi:hypothetical protein